MGNRIKKGVLAVAAILFALAFGACAEPAAMNQAESQKVQELGDAFVSDLQKIIIPAMEEPYKLLDEGYVLSEGDKSYGMDVLAEFSVTYDKSGGSSVTMIFDNKAFVAARIVFTGGRGYYLRYQYDKFNPKDISVSAQLVDHVDLEYQERPPKWEMSVSNSNKQIASFAFNDPQETDKSGKEAS